MTGITAPKNPFLFTRQDLLVCLFLIVVTLAPYWQVQDYDFVNYDDDMYITENHHVQSGLTLEGVVWAFTTVHVSNWHPLTWLSHMLDCQVYLLNPGGHHWTNLLFHILNTLLLFMVLKWMTGTFWQSALVAAIFALHPLHVESVVWVSERKDVLSTFFWMLTMWAYLLYIKHPNINRYLFVLLAFVLGLMSKPMLVTLPFVLLLLDYWPLDLLRRGNARPMVFRQILEKTPFFALSAISSVATLLAQQSGGAVRSLELLSLKIRIGNALVCYASYIKKMLWPHHLAVLYPHPGMSPMWQIAGACLLLTFISIVVIRLRRSHPYLVVGWLWYLITLIPVIGLIQVGSQAMADRYTYVPLIGLFIMFAWGVSCILERWGNRKTVLAVSTAVLLSIFMVCTWAQVRHWRNSITLFKHALNVTANNNVAHNNLGIALARDGKLDEAIDHYLEALRIKPGFAEAHNNIGIILSCRGKFKEAIAHYSKALRIRSDYVEAHNNMGILLTRIGRVKEAIDHFREALRIKPAYEKAHINLGGVLTAQGKYEEAVGYFVEGLKINPKNAEAYNNLGVAFMNQGRIGEAITHFREALRLKPDYIDASKNLKIALSMRKNGKSEENDRKRLGQ